MVEKDAPKGETIQGVAFPDETLLSPEQRVFLQRYLEKLGLERKDLGGEEEWRPVGGFSRYEVSNRGEVRSKKSGRRMGRFFNRNFYWVNLTQNDGSRRTVRVHLLVYRAFVDQDYDSLKGRLEFLDGDRGNIVPDNIRPMKKPAKERPRGPRLPEGTLREIKTQLEKGDLTGTQIAIKCGVSPTTVWRVKTGQIYRRLQSSVSPNKISASKSPF